MGLGQGSYSKITIAVEPGEAKISVAHWQHAQHSIEPTDDPRLDRARFSSDALAGLEPVRNGRFFAAWVGTNNEVPYIQNR